MDKKYCRLCNSPITPENELSAESGLCKPCAEGNATEYDTLRLSTSADLSDKITDRKPCRRCGASMAAGDGMYGIDDLCKSCAGSNAGRHYAKVRETERKYCHRCGKMMTAENKMFGTNPDGSRNEEFCHSCVERGVAANESSVDENYPDIWQSIQILAIILFAPILVIPLFIVIGRKLELFGFQELTTIVTFWIIYSIRKRKTGVGSFDFSIKNKWIVPLAIISIYALGVSIVSPLHHLAPESNNFEQAMHELAKQPTFLLFLGMVIIAPIFEELIFRGIILAGYLKNYSPLKAILASSFLFGFVHLNITQFIGGFFFGMFFGWAYYKTRSISFSIILHAAVNFLPFLVLVFADCEACKASSTNESSPDPLLFVIVGLISFCIFLTSAYFLNRELNKSAAAPQSAI